MSISAHVAQAIYFFSDFFSLSTNKELINGEKLANNLYLKHEIFNSETL